MKSKLSISLNERYDSTDEKFSKLCKIIETGKFSSISVASNPYQNQEEDTKLFKRMIALVKVIAESPVKFIALSVFSQDNFDKVYEIIKILTTSDYLESLMLDDCLIREEDFVNILDVVSSSKLKSLQFTKETLIPSEQREKSFPNLEKSINSLSKLTKLTSLEHLSLSTIGYNNFKKYLSKITETVLSCSSLNNIDFSGNNLFYIGNKDYNPKLFLDSFEKLMPKIRKFNISNNYIGQDTKTAITFARMIEGSKLEELNVSNSILFDLEPQNLSLCLQYIFGAKTLKSLNISGNSFKEDNLPLLASFVKNSKLKSFYFAQHNYFKESKIFFDFCETLSKAPNLQFVSLAKVFFLTKLTPKDISESLAILCQSKTLNSIDLSNNLSAHMNYKWDHNDNFFNSIANLANILSNSNITSLIFRRNFYKINDNLVEFLKTMLQSKTIKYLDITPVCLYKISEKEEDYWQKVNNIIKKIDQFLESKQKENICIVKGYIIDASVDLFERNPDEIVQIIGEYNHCEVVFDQGYSV